MSKFPSLFLFRSKSTILLFSHDSSPVWVLTKRALDFVVLQEIHRAQQTSLIKPLSSASAAHARDRELVSQRARSGEHSETQETFPGLHSCWAQKTEITILCCVMRQNNTAPTRISKINIAVENPPAPQLEAFSTRRPKKSAFVASNKAASSNIGFSRSNTSPKDCLSAKLTLRKWCWRWEMLCADSWSPGATDGGPVLPLQSLGRFLSAAYASGGCRGGLWGLGGAQRMHLCAADGRAIPLVCTHMQMRC